MYIVDKKFSEQPRETLSVSADMGVCFWQMVSSQVSPACQVCNRYTLFCHATDTLFCVVISNSYPHVHHTYGAVSSGGGGLMDINGVEGSGGSRKKIFVGLAPHHLGGNKD